MYILYVRLSINYQTDNEEIFHRGNPCKKLNKQQLNFFTF